VILFLGFSRKFKGARKVLLCCSNSGRKSSFRGFTGMKNVEILVKDKVQDEKQLENRGCRIRYYFNSRYNISSA
jgi:hypothetical protein